MKKHGRITAYIHLDRVEENFRNLKANLKEGTKMVAVMKADGYGHGAEAIAKRMEEKEYIWGFAVAAHSEAMELRNAGISRPIMILGYTFAEDYEEMILQKIRPTVFTLEMAREFSDAAGRLGVCAPVHLAVDTGMTRIGVKDTPEGIALAKSISDLPNIRIEGVFTHFAKADELDKTYAKMQLERYVRFCDAIEEAGVPKFLRHCSNSAAILEMKEANMDMVRAGIVIYGIYPSDEVDWSLVPIRPVMELKSHVVYIKDVPAGTSISYGGTYVAPSDRRIATIPVGYADGYPRSLSSKGEVLIRGQRAPIVGRVCMDQFMVDVTGLEVQMLDEVTLMGRDGEDEITVYELAERSGRFPYEFVCDISKRVPRVFVTE